jgi:ABC-2 type transport system ATP-binding protein
MDRWREIADRRFGRCSGGERAWLLCALMLFLDRELYLLDEPTVGVDPEFRALIWNRIRLRAREGKTILVSSHLLDEIGQNVDRLILLLAGQVRTFDDVDSFKRFYGKTTADEAFQAAVALAFGVSV